MLTERLLSIFRKEGDPVSNGLPSAGLQSANSARSPSRVRIGEPEIGEKRAPSDAPKPGPRTVLF